jgi:hypothetical protein
MRRQPAGGGQALIAHPDTPAHAVEGVFYTRQWRSPGEWQFTFHVAAPPSALKLPSPAEPARVDGLWKHTCFEAFIRNPADGTYLEFNFSPSGQWAAYQFDGYRAGMRELPVSVPHITSADMLAPTYWMTVSFEQPGLWPGVACQVGLSAVIEEADGTKSYWALNHAPGKPDFHAADNFLLEFPGSPRR